MKEISNSTLALLVVVAIVVSVFGSLMSLNRLDQLGGFGGITGLLSTNTTGIGRANLTVPASAFLNITDNVIELGNLLQTETNTSDIVDDWWAVRNDGSVNITIRVYSHVSDNQTGGGNPAGVAGRGPFTAIGTPGCLGNAGLLSDCFMVKCYNSTSAASTTNRSLGLAICNTTYEALPGAAGGTTSRTLLTNLSSVTGNNTAFFGASATVPVDEPAGIKEQLVEFYAEQSN